MQQARLIAYPPDSGAAIIRSLAPDELLRIGRASDCGLVLEHASVSRAHAELRGEAGGWRLRDLGSKNGSFIDGHPTSEAMLDRTCWLRFGDVHCEFAVLDAVQAAALSARQQSRHAQSQALIRRIDRQAPFGALLDDILRGVLELAGCSRGFLLMARGDDYVVCASRTIDPSALNTRNFSGSVGAVQRALTQRKPVVVNQMDSEPWLAGRASVIGLGLQCLVCLPLLDGERVLGAVYADRSEPGEPITQLDVELLSAFAESAAVWMLAGQAIDALESAPRWKTIVSAHTSEGHVA